MRPAHDEYALQMKEFNYGHALWVPEPIGYDEMRIGDVGYHSKGVWYRLFNAMLPRDHPANALGVPTTFEQLHLPPDPVNSLLRNDKFLDAGALHTSTVMKAHFGISTEGAALPGGAGIHFSCNSSKGAVLIQKRHSIREDAIPEQTIENYILKHFRSWYGFNDSLGRRPRRGEIMFITGFDKTAEWAAALFNESSTSGGISFFGGLPLVVNGEVQVSGSWESTTSVQHRSGPTTVLDPPKFDQAIFIRGYRVKDRTFGAPRVIRAAAESPDDEYPDQEGRGSPAPLSPVSDISTGSNNTWYILQSIPGNYPDFDCTDAILDCIFSTSNVAAIAHTTDWCDPDAFHKRCPQSGHISAQAWIEAYATRFFEETGAVDTVNSDSSQQSSASPSSSTASNSSHVVPDPKVSHFTGLAAFFDSLTSKSSRHGISADPGALDAGTTNTEDDLRLARQDKQALEALEDEFQMNNINPMTPPPTRPSTPATKDGDEDDDKPMSTEMERTEEKIGHDTEAASESRRRAIEHQPMLRERMSLEHADLHKLN